MEIVETESLITQDGMKSGQHKRHLITIGLSPEEFSVLGMCIVCGANMLNLDAKASTNLAGMRQTVERHLSHLR